MRIKIKSRVSKKKSKYCNSQATKNIMHNMLFFKMGELYSFVVHSMTFREYVQCVEMIIQKMCLNVTCSDYMFTASE